MAEPTKQELDEIEVEMELEALWETVKTAVPRPKTVVQVEESTRSMYLNPANWTRMRALALIHAESQTILGTFSEYIHKRIPNCRKLLREEALLEISGVEMVSGSWWLGDSRIPEPPQVWHRRVPATLHLHLDTLRVHSPGVEVTVCLSYGNIVRCELNAETRFATWAEDPATPMQLLFLPAGTNVYEVMSRECKIKLKEILG